MIWGVIRRIITRIAHELRIERCIRCDKLMWNDDYIFCKGCNYHFHEILEKEVKDKPV